MDKWWREGGSVFDQFATFTAPSMKPDDLKFCTFIYCYKGDPASYLQLEFV